MSLPGKWTADDNGQVDWLTNEDYADDAYDRDEQEELDNDDTR